ncbi:MAG: type VI secretion system tube protein Hcp [Caldimonas sp.]
MSNSVAEAYLLIVRESNVPIFGEAVPMPFTGQIEVDSWTWEIKNKLQQPADGAEAGGDGGQAATATQESAAATSATAARDRAAAVRPDELIRQVVEMQNKTGLTQPQRDRKVQELIKRAVDGFADVAGRSEAANNPNAGDAEKNAMKFTFEKGVDLATTPMLFALARGDVMPTALLTLFHRAKNAPVTLAITMRDVRLTTYEVTCDPDDKMADLKEKWEATYQRIDWMYQNRPAAAGPNFLTQGTVRVFVMSEETLPV